MFIGSQRKYDPLSDILWPLQYIIILCLPSFQRSALNQVISSGTFFEGAAKMTAQFEAGTKQSTALVQTDCILFTTKYIWCGNKSCCKSFGFVLLLVDFKQHYEIILPLKERSQNLLDTLRQLQRCNKGPKKYEVDAIFFLTH